METIINIEARIEAKELKIIPPEGYEVDKENSTFDCIKFKSVVKKWRDNEKALIGGMFIGLGGKIDNYFGKNTKENYNVFATEKQAKSALAMARISQIMANDERFGGVVTDEEWDKYNIPKYCISRGPCVVMDTEHIHYHFLAFHTFDQCELFYKENADLIKDYLML